jgi:hypothetical protein
MKCTGFAIATVAVPIIFICLLTAPTFAQDKGFGGAGVIEIAGSISFASITPVSNGKTEDATTFLSLAPEISYFATDGFEIGFNPGVSLLPGISVITPSKGDGTTILQLFASPAYNFHSEGSEVNPFLSIPFGYTSASSGSMTQSGFSWGVKGGIKIVAVQNLLFTVYGQYMALSFTPEKATERSGFNFLSFGVGVGGFFSTKD